MNDLTDRLMDAAAEAFPMLGPVYEFGFTSPEACDSRSSPIDPDPPEPSAQIDRLEDLDRLPFPDGDARTVVCRNALQYVFEPRRAMDEMTRILAPGGLLLVVESTQSASPGSGQRYWTVHPGALGRLFESFGGTLLGWIGPDASPHTVFGLGCKSPLSAEFAQGVRPFLDRVDRALAETTPRPAGLGALARRWVEWIGPGGRHRSPRDEQRVQCALHLPVNEQSRPAILQGCLPATKLGTRLDLSD